VDGCGSPSRVPVTGANLDCLTRGRRPVSRAVSSAAMADAPQVLMFDLGGVLVEFTGVRDLAILLPEHATAAEIVDRWMRCPHSEAFGVGKLSLRDYAEHFVRDWGIRLAPDAFLREYRSWSRRLYPGAEALLDALRPRYRLAALSNSNEAHWDRNTRDLGITELFEVAISSHQVGLAKPDPAIYLAALARLNVAAADVVFFDDLKANVAAALDLGIRAFQVNGVEDIRSALAAEGWL